MRQICLLAAVLAAPLAISGCATEDLVALNQKVSDYAYSANRVIYGGRVTRDTVNKQFIVNVDVDTAAARIKQYYGFMDVQAERARLSSPGVANAGIKGAVLEQNRMRFEATPGVFYRMASNFGKHDPADHLDITLHKEGAQTSILVRHESSFENTQTASHREETFQLVEDVALGRKRRY